jgi:hypothetical protein
LGETFTKNLFPEKIREWVKVIKPGSINGIFGGDKPEKYNRE